MPEGENVGLWECFITLTCLSLQVDNEKLSHALLCLFTSFCLGFSKAFLIICYWHSCSTIFDLSENDIIIVGIKRPRLHFPLRQMKRQMGKIKNLIWRAKHTFRHTQTRAHCESYSQSLRSNLKLGAVLMINERSITTVLADVLLPETRICSFANSNELFGALLLTDTKAVTWPLLNLCSTNYVRSGSPACQHPCDTPALFPNSPAKFWGLISSMWLWGIFCKSCYFSVSPFFSVTWSALIDFCYEGCTFSGSEVSMESCAVASTGSKHSIAQVLCYSALLCAPGIICSMSM